MNNLNLYLKIFINVLIVSLIIYIVIKLFVFLLPVILILIVVYYIYRIYGEVKYKYSNNKTSKKDKDIVEAEIIEEKFDK